MEHKFTPELIEKARQTKSIEELLNLAETNGITITQDEAENYFAQLHQSVELSDDELNNVSGGGCGSKSEGDKCDCGGTLVKGYSFEYMRDALFCDKCWRLYWP
ncbi:MAG: bacteriocin [Oscillospiraceae bacterium]|nr:bacteriocin [Oscillospiraceae bacterium]